MLVRTRENKKAPSFPPLHFVPIFQLWVQFLANKCGLALLGALQLVRTLYELHFKCHYAGGGSRKDKKMSLFQHSKGR